MLSRYIDVTCRAYDQSSKILCLFQATAASIQHHSVVEEACRPAPISARLLNAGVPGEIEQDSLFGIGLDRCRSVLKAGFHRRPNYVRSTQGGSASRDIVTPQSTTRLIVSLFFEARNLPSPAVPYFQE
jgi:hypothetical protein